MDSITVGNATFVYFGVTVALDDSDSGDVVVGVGDDDISGVIVVVFGVTAGGCSGDIVGDIGISHKVINTGDGDGLGIFQLVASKVTDGMTVPSVVSLLTKFRVTSAVG